MGLGKTAICLSALTPEHLPALVVAPRLVASETWPTEIEKWRPDLSHRLVNGQFTAEQRPREYRRKADIFITTRDLHQDAIGARKWRTIIFDESDSFKSESTARFKNAVELNKRAPFTWILTGTPMPKGPMDLWSQVYLIDRGERLGRKITDYRTRYFDYVLDNPYADKRSGKWAWKPGAHESVMNKLSDICLSMTKATYLDLPEFTKTRAGFALPPEAKAPYNQARKDLVVALNDVLGVVEVPIKSAAVLTSKLSQITAGFLYDEARNPIRIHDAKVDMVEELVEQVGGPVLVLYRFHSERDALMARFGDRAHRPSPGFTARWDRGEIPVLVAHPAEVGHGLNLQHGGHNLIWSSPTWSTGMDLQANNRFHRPGQTKPVVSSYVLARGTVDERIMDTNESEIAEQDALLDWLEVPL